MEINRSGFITNYLISGPRITDFVNDSSDKNQLRYEQYLRTIVAEREQKEPAGEIILGELSALGEPWKYYYSYQNWFVDMGTFYSTLQKVELDAATVLEADCAMEVPVIFWSYAAITVWCNGDLVCLINNPVYKPIQKKRANLRLKKGNNRLYIRLQNLGVRDTRTLFGIQLKQHPQGLWVTLPDWEHTKRLTYLEAWLAGIDMKDSRLTFTAAAPAGSRLGYDNKSPDYADVEKRIKWQGIEGKTSVLLDKTRTGVIHISAGQGEMKLTRTLKNIAAQVPEYTEETDFETNKGIIWQRIANVVSLSRGDQFGFAISNILARKALNQLTAQDEQLLAETFDQIDARYDCSDFLLCGVIRYMKNYPLPEVLAKRVKEVFLNYRYWMDQQGTDAMCFWSENHALMFYTCMMNVGEMYPDEYFARAGKTGAELYQEGRKKVEFWLTDVEQYGFEEFLSTVYMCVTFAALLNVIDYSDRVISARAVKVTDKLLRMLAKHTFDGSVLAPMGRVYGEVVHPFQQGAQALMNLIDPQVPFTYGEGWLGFYATSKYRLPLDLKNLMQDTANVTYATGNALVCLHKQKEYCLTSVCSPRFDEGFKRWENLTLKEQADPSTCEYTKSLNERFHGTTCFEPGVYGYQQHLWYAALDKETNVFTNHPGSSCEDSSLRPGYWYGNGVMPAITQVKNRIGIVYHIPDAHPIHFTHAYFPAEKFTETVILDNWLFGSKKDGYLTLWCSEPMELVSDQLFGCEFRSYGDDIAYVCWCDAAGEYEDFPAFINAAKQRVPQFDKSAGILTGQGLNVRYTDSHDKTQYI